MQEPISRTEQARETNKKQNATDHLANERTLLAWVRTSIGIMAFGFVVVKFSLFIKQLSYLVGKDIAAPQSRHSSVIGILLVALGSVVLLLSLIRYKKTERQLLTGSYQPSSGLILILTIIIIALSVGLIIYLIENSFDA